MPLNMKPSFAHSNVAAVKGAWPVMGFTSHQQVHDEPSGRMCCWVLPLPPLHSPASWWSVRTTPPPGTSEVAPKWAIESTWFGWVFTESAGLSSCVFVGISPRRAKLGGVPRGVRSADAPPPTPAAGAPPAGPWQELVWQFVPQRLKWDVTSHLVSDSFGRLLAKYLEVLGLTMPGNVLIGVRPWRSRGHHATTGHNLRSVSSRTTRMAVWAHRMVDLERLISWLSALISTGGLMHQAPWTPVANDLVAVEKRQDKQQGKSIVSGTRAYFYFWVPIMS
jgi:hypothetical protein